MAKRSKDESMIHQSNYLTSSSYEYTAQEKRVLYRIIEKANEFRKEHSEYFTEHDGEYIVQKHVPMEMPITAFMNNDQLKHVGGTQYREVTDAFEALVKKTISVNYTKDTPLHKKGDWVGGSLINLPELKNGIMTFIVHKFIWQAALDFTAGFSKIDILTTMNFKSVYAMRFYEIAKRYNQTKFWTVSIDEFREMFGCSNKYDAFTDLEKRVIRPAKKELDKSSPISFIMDKKKDGKKIVTLLFQFYRTNNKTSFLDDFDSDELLKKYSTAVLSPELKNWLKYKLDLTTNQIKSNLKLFADFERVFKEKSIDELEETFRWINDQKTKPQEHIGLFIQNLKAKVNNATGRTNED